jgi:hypothetical protein
LRRRAGARIVTCQEHAVLLPEEDEQELVEECRQEARNEGICLVMAPPDFPSVPWKNKLSEIDRPGRII